MKTQRNYITIALQHKEKGNKLSKNQRTRTEIKTARASTQEETLQHWDEGESRKKQEKSLPGTLKAPEVLPASVLENVRVPPNLLSVDTTTVQEAVQVNSDCQWLVRPARDPSEKTG